MALVLIFHLQHWGTPSSLGLFLQLVQVCDSYTLNTENKSTVVYILLFRTLNPEFIWNILSDTIRPFKIRNDTAGIVGSQQWNINSLYFWPWEDACMRLSKSGQLVLCTKKFWLYGRKAEVTFTRLIQQNQNYISECSHILAKGWYLGRERQRTDSLHPTGIPHILHSCLDTSNPNKPARCRITPGDHQQHL